MSESPIKRAFDAHRAEKSAAEVAKIEKAREEDHKKAVEQRRISARVAVIRPLLDRMVTDAITAGHGATANTHMNPGNVSLTMQIAPDRSKRFHIEVTVRVEKDNTIRVSTDLHDNETPPPGQTYSTVQAAKAATVSDEELASYLDEKIYEGMIAGLKKLDHE